LRREDDPVKFPLVTLCRIPVNVFDRFDAAKGYEVGLDSNDVAYRMSIVPWGIHRALYVAAPR
jgi:hypothetical protein